MTTPVVYVWSGSLRGVEVQAFDPDVAVVLAVQRQVREQGYALLGPAIRVSLEPREAHPLDVYYEPPYERTFPELFDGDLDVRIIPIEGAEET